MHVTKRKEFCSAKDPIKKIKGKTHWEKRVGKFLSTHKSCLKEGNKQTNEKISTSLGGNENIFSPGSLKF